jgi:putative heme iron utilization protein
MESLQQKLQKELTEAEVAKKQAVNYERLSKEVHDINILRDSNVLLRTEKDSLQSKLNKLETKVSLCYLKAVLFS